MTETSRTVQPLPRSTAQSSSSKGPKFSSVIALRSFPVGRQVCARARRVPMASNILLKCTVFKGFFKAEIRRRESRVSEREISREWAGMGPRSSANDPRASPQDMPSLSSAGSPCCFSALLLDHDVHEITQGWESQYMQSEAPAHKGREAVRTSAT